MRREIEGCRVIDGAIINRELSDSSKLVNPTRWAVLNRSRQPLFKAAHLNLSPLQPRKKNDFESDDSAAAFSFNHNKGATKNRGGIVSAILFRGLISNKKPKQDPT